MIKVVGSNFYEYKMDEIVRENFQIFGIDKSYMIDYYLSGRNGIKAIARHIYNCNKKIVLIPEYTCNSVYEPFVDENWEIIFYKIKKDLTVDIDDIKSKIKIKKVGALLLHSYFGFNTLKNTEEVIKTCQNRSIVVIEDITQSLFSKHKRLKSDYYVGSLRKWFAIPSGGILLSKQEMIEKKFCLNINIDKLFINACDNKQKYIDLDGNVDESKKKYRDEFNKIEDLMNGNGNLLQITELSKVILNNVDLENIEKKRKENYNFLLNGLAQFKQIKIVFKELDEESVPLYFPVFLKSKKEREKFQSFMIKNSIYCPIIWPQVLSNKVLSSSSKYIYDHILCIPCDQRYNNDDMNYIIDVIKVYVNT